MSWRLARVRGSKVRYQNEQTAKMGPWVPKTAFQDNVGVFIWNPSNQRYQVGLSIAAYGRIGKAMVPFSQAMGKFATQVGENVRSIGTSLTKAFEDHPANQQAKVLPGSVAVLEADDDHPDFEDLPTKEQLDREDWLSKQRVGDLVSVITYDRIKYGYPPGGASKMRKADLIAWIMQHDVR